MVTQGGAVTNRRIQQSQIPAIQARAELLPYYYSQKKDEAYQDKSYQLARDQLNQEAELGREGLSLQRDIADEQAQQADKAARMARMQLGMETGLGIGRLTDDAPKNTPVASTGNAIGNKAASMGGLEGQDAAGGLTEPGVLDKTKNALTSGDTWASTAFGALAGPELGDAALKDTGIGKRERRMLGGAAAGGAAGYLSSGGDLYSTALSAGLSSLGGLL